MTRRFSIALALTAGLPAAIPGAIPGDIPGSIPSPGSAWAAPAATGSDGGTRHVDDDAPAGGDGLTWATAYRFLQDAIAEAAAPGAAILEIRVAGGVYPPDRSAASPGGTGASGATFRLVDGSSLRGGYAGVGAPDPDARDVATNETILTGDVTGAGPNAQRILTATTSGPIVIDGFTVTGGNANDAGTGGGLFADGVADLTLLDCSFVDNSAYGGAGAAYIVETGTVAITRCRFVGNTAGMGGALIVEAVSSTLSGCTFIDNNAPFLGGGMVDIGTSTLVNCVFSRNGSNLGGGVHAFRTGAVINCTFSENTGSGFVIEDGSEPLISNTIFWGNVPDGIAQDPFAPGLTPTLVNCDYEGGWTGPGSGNIDADPIFLLPGLDDVRLSTGSPCLEAGDNGAVPPGVIVDAGGDPRIQNGTVDIGAYEGGRAPVIPTATAVVDAGVTVTLVPAGGPPDPLANVTVVFTNLAGPDGATVTVSEHADPLHPGAGGFTAPGRHLRLETSLPDGAFFALVFIPFDASSTGGADPTRLDLTGFAEGPGVWAVAVSRNDGTSPGAGGVIGDRITSLAPAPPATTPDLGDWGVFSDAAAARGFVWANLDHAGDLAYGVPVCPPDASQPPDGRVDVFDLLAVLGAWSRGAGPFDVNDDGVVNVLDLLAVLGAWGVCP